MLIIYDYNVIEAIANSGIVLQRYFDVDIFDVDENGEQIGTLYSEELVPSSCWQVFIPKKYKDMTAINWYTGFDCGHHYIVVDVRTE